MLASKNHARRFATRQASYVCPNCQTRAFSSVSPQSHEPFRAWRQRHNFSTLDRRRATVESGPPSPDKSKSAIRSHLRVWNVQNKKKLQLEADRAEGDTRRLRRIATLPNSLFLDQATSDNVVPDEDEAMEQGGTGGFGDDDASDIYKLQKQKPGDLFWWFPSPGTKFASAQLALCLGSAYRQHQYMLADGRWVSEKSRNPTSPFIEGFASQTEVDEIRKHLPVKPLHAQSSEHGVKLDFSMTGDLPTTVTESIMTRFVQFGEDMSTWRRQNLTLLDSLYDRMAGESRFVSLQFNDLVTKFLGVPYEDVPAAARMVIYRHLSAKLASVITLRHLSFWPTATVFITPLKMARDAAQVCTWAREYQELAAQAATGQDVTTILEANPLSQFVAKARRLILTSRNLRSPTTIGSLGPSSIQGMFQKDRIPREKNAEDFTPNDIMFIQFIWDCYIRFPAQHLNRNMAIASLILRAVGAYPKLRLDATMGRLLLQELGTLPPWSSLADNTIALQLPHTSADGEMMDIYNAADRFCDQIGLDSEQRSGLSAFTDSMADLREDMVDMPVYLLDEFNTLNKEDGVSVESNPAIPDTYWVHGHIANPTAFVDHHHIMMTRARMLGITILYGSRLSRMLPIGFTRAASLFENGPALTLSTLLTMQGDVLEVKLRPTVVRNMISLSTHAVDHVLGKPVRERASLTLGMHGMEELRDAPEAYSEEIEAAEKQLPALELLHKLLHARHEKRLKEVEVVPNWRVPGARAAKTVINMLGNRFTQKELFVSQQFQGDPPLLVAADRYIPKMRVQDLDRDASITPLLAEFLAESAGKWFGDRKIPAIYFGMTYRPGYPPERLNNLGPEELGEYPGSQLSSSAIPNVYKSMKSQLWLSNPLRRYPDLISAWNAQAYLRAEANGDIAPGAPGDKLQMPFSKAMCDQYIAQDIPKIYTLRLTLGYNEKNHWTAQALFRAFHFKEVELPEVWDLLVTRAEPKGERRDDTGLRGLVLPFQIRAVVVASKEGWEKDVKREWYLPVRLEVVDVTRKELVVRPVGPPSQDHTQIGRIDCAPSTVLDRGIPETSLARGQRRRRQPDEESEDGFLSSVTL